MHLLAKPGTEVKVIGIGNYTEKPKRQRRVSVKKVGSVDTTAQMAIHVAYAILDDTSIGNLVLFEAITKGSSLTQIDCSVALEELVARGYVESGSIGTSDGWHYHLTDAGKRWIQDNREIIEKFRGT